MIFKNVLVALDGSTRAERALPWVRVVAPFSQVTLALAIEPSPLFETGSQFVLADRYLGTIADTFVPRARVISRTGSPTLTLLDVAEEVKADLIVVTARHGEETLGRVTEKILHGSTIPILVVPSEGDRPIQINKLLVPLDGSKISEMILPWVSEISKQLGAKMVLSHVIERPSEEEWRALESQFPREAPGFKGLEEAIQERRSRLETYLSHCAKNAEAKFVIQEGRPVEALLALADYEDADLIVMAAHGHGYISRVVIGSVASKLIRKSKIPVLVAKYDVLKSLTPDPVFSERGE